MKTFSAENFEQEDLPFKINRLSPNMSQDRGMFAPAGWISMASSLAKYSLREKAIWAGLTLQKTLRTVINLF